MQQIIYSQMAFIGHCGGIAPLWCLERTQDSFINARLFFLLQSGNFTQGAVLGYLFCIRN